LIERHLIAGKHAANRRERLVLNKDESLACDNEEDHLRMQAFAPGLKSGRPGWPIDQFDSALERVLDYAFRESRLPDRRPTNLGTGIRVSAMLHLPALVVRTGKPDHQAVNKLGLAVRGLYGEGTEALGIFSRFQPDDVG